MTQTNKDRISVTMTFKTGLPNYSSADIQISLASDVEEGETSDNAYSRVSDFVKNKLEEEKWKLGEAEVMSKLENSKVSNGRPAPLPVSSNGDPQEKPKTQMRFSGLSKLKKTDEAISEKVEEPKVETPKDSTASTLASIKEKYGIKTQANTGEESSAARLKR